MFFSIPKTVKTVRGKKKTKKTLDMYFLMKRKMKLSFRHIETQKKQKYKFLFSRIINITSLLHASHWAKHTIRCLF